jgi:hypothetical protein
MDCRRYPRCCGVHLSIPRHSARSDPTHVLCTVCDVDRVETESEPLGGIAVRDVLVEEATAVRVEHIVLNEDRPIRILTKRFGPRLSGNCISTDVDALAVAVVERLVSDHAVDKAHEAQRVAASRITAGGTTLVENVVIDTEVSIRV